MSKFKPLKTFIRKSGLCERKQNASWRSKTLYLCGISALALSITAQPQQVKAQSTISRTCNPPGNNVANQQLTQNVGTDFAQFSNVPDDARFVIIISQNGGPQSVNNSGARVTRTGGNLLTTYNVNFGPFGRGGSRTDTRVVRSGTATNGSVNFRIQINGSGAPRRTAWRITCLDDGPTVTGDVDQTVDSAVTVNVPVVGVEPNDPDTVSYAWTAPADIVLTGANTASPSFISPIVPAVGPPRVIPLTLTVTDDDGDQVTTMVDITVNPAVIADLVTTKTLSSGDDTPEEGDTVTYQIAVRNDGPANGTNVTLTDTLPTGLTATANNGATDDGSGNAVGTYNDTTGVWNIGTMANGASATLTIEGVVEPGFGGSTIINSTTAATADQPDPTDDGNDLEEEVTVERPNANLSITKTNTPGVNGEVDQTDDTLTSGNTVTYTITITNNGPDATTGAVVRDVISSGLTCAPTNTVTITGSGVPTGDFTFGDLTGAGITLWTLDDQQSTTLTYTCEVN